MNPTGNIDQIEMIDFYEGKYIGQVQNNKPHGFGIYYRPKNNSNDVEKIISKGHWHNGLPVPKQRIFSKTDEMVKVHHDRADH